MFAELLGAVRQLSPQQLDVIQQGRLMRDKACMLFTPLRAGAAHVMQLRPVRIEHSPPLPNDRIETERWRAGSKELAQDVGIREPCHSNLHHVHQRKTDSWCRCVYGRSMNAGPSYAGRNA